VSEDISRGRECSLGWGVSTADQSVVLIQRVAQLAIVEYVA